MEKIKLKNIYKTVVKAIIREELVKVKVTEGGAAGLKSKLRIWCKISLKI